MKERFLHGLCHADSTAPFLVAKTFDFFSFLISNSQAQTFFFCFPSYLPYLMSGAGSSRGGRNPTLLPPLAELRLASASRSRRELLAAEEEYLEVLHRANARHQALRALANRAPVLQPSRKPRRDSLGTTNAPLNTDSREADAERQEDAHAAMLTTSDPAGRTADAEDASGIHSQQLASCAHQELVFPESGTRVPLAISVEDARVPHDDEEAAEVQEGPWTKPPLASVSQRGILAVSSSSSSCCAGSAGGAEMPIWWTEGLRRVQARVSSKIPVIQRLDGPLRNDLPHPRHSSSHLFSSPAAPPASAVSLIVSHPYWGTRTAADNPSSDAAKSLPGGGALNPSVCSSLVGSCIPDPAAGRGSIFFQRCISAGTRQRIEVLTQEIFKGSQ
jgi:hypothetical protein